MDRIEEPLSKKLHLYQSNGLKKINNLELKGIYRANVHQRCCTLSESKHSSVEAEFPNTGLRSKSAQEVRSDFYILQPLQARGALGLPFTWNNWAGYTSASGH